MAKLTLSPISSRYASVAALNANFDAIEEALENTLSRDGTSPNEMTSDLDMNGHRILNELATTGEGFIWGGAWVTATAYVLNNLVSNSGNSYICTTAHTSDVFATDLAAGKWELLASKGAAGAGSGDMVGSNNLSDLTDAVAARTNLGVAIGSQVQAYSAGIPTAAASQAEAEAGSDNTKWVSSLRVSQAIDAQVSVSLPTGMTVDYVGSTAPTGWVLLDGRTIGSASSGATNRANADTSDLYTLLWNSMADTEAQVSTGRGASAAADFAANKTLTLPDARGRTIAGKDNMGGSTASRLTAAASGITGTTLGTSGGTQTHTLTTAQLPSHSHGLTLYDAAPGTSAVAGGSGGTVSGSPTTNSAGSGDAHNNTQPTLILNKMVKL
jgi:microcystin-dependent protein